eukprot:9636471-Heterocapsa_arctica.AAC.1
MHVVLQCQASFSGSAQAHALAHVHTCGPWANAPYHTHTHIVLSHALGRLPDILGPGFGLYPALTSCHAVRDDVHVPTGPPKGSPVSKL